MDRKARLFKTLERMESERAGLLASMSHLDSGLLEKKPTPEAWSVAQVIVHIATAEEASLDYLRKKLEVGGHGRASAVAVLRSALLELALWLPIRYKAPAGLAQVPEMPMSRALQRWDAVRRAMRNTYTELSEEQVSHELFKHPLVGKMGLLQGLRSLRRHALHHHGQVGRTVRATQALLRER